MSIASKLLVSDLETAFLRFENLFRVNCLCLLKIFLFIVCLFIRIYPIVCLCGVITRSYFSLLISQLCNTIVCLFPKLFSDIRFRMMDARSFLVVLISYTVSPYGFLGLAYFWSCIQGWREKYISIPENDCYFFVTSLS